MLEVLNLLKIAAAVVGVILIPGYGLVLALFPRQNDLERAEVIGLAGALGLMVNTLIGILLIQVGIGIKLPYQLGLVYLLTGLAFVRFLLRRSVLASDDPAQPQASPFTLSWNNLQAGVVGILILLLPLSIFPVIFENTAPQEYFTEFYALPMNQPIQPTSTITVGVVNQEGQTTEYTLVAVIDSGTTYPLSTITLNPGEQREMTLATSDLPRAPQEQLQFELYRLGNNQPYRTLTLRVSSS